jgi:hypothetical protein
MNLAATISLYLYAGGAGSGCHGANCGRPPIGIEKEAGIQRIAHDNDIDPIRQRSLAERMWREEQFGNFTNLQRWAKASSDAWVPMHSGDNSVTYRKSLGRGAGIVYLTVGESRMGDYEHGRPTMFVEVMHKMKDSDQTHTTPTQRTFEWEPRHDMAQQYLQQQWGLRDSAWRTTKDAQTLSPQEV